MVHALLRRSINSTASRRQACVGACTPQNERPDIVHTSKNLPTILYAPNLKLKFTFRMLVKLENLNLERNSHKAVLGMLQH